MTEQVDPRYSRQILLEELGAEGQLRLGAASVLLVGGGGLGATVAELLVRAGVGRVRLVDRDIIELHNLHRQLLYDEEDVKQCLPKAVAAAEKLRRINGSVTVDAQTVDLGAHNVRELIRGMDLVVDATDNVESRYLVNDACLELGVPWIYGGAIGTTGMTLSIFPNDGPCLRCIFPEPPPPGSLPTCDTRGVLNTIPSLVASLQASEAFKILTKSDRASRDLVVIDPWQGSYQRLGAARSSDCPACGQGRRDFLKGFDTTQTTRLCGRNAVQVDPPQDLALTLEALLSTLKRVGRTEYNGHVVQFWIDDYELVVFADGRALVKGTTDPTTARSLYAKYVGA